MSFLFFLLDGCTLLEPTVERKPDVLIVVLDTVRADHLSTYGYDKDTSPILTELAKQGVLFQDVTAPSSWTWPSHASIFTGTMPWEHGAHRSSQGTQMEGSDWFLSSMDASLPTMAQRFSQSGYETYAFSTNMLLKKELGLMRGFSQVQAIDDEESTMKAAIEVLSREHEKPIFIFVNLMTAHAPYLVHKGVDFSAAHIENYTRETAPNDWRTPYIFEEYPGIHFPIFMDNGLNGEMAVRKGDMQIPAVDQQSVIDLYDGELLRLDYMLGLLLRSWGERSGIVAVTADHGEYLFEHSRVGHGVELHPPVLSVPLILAYPGVLKPQKIAKPTSLIRLAPTILSLAGLNGTGALSSKYSVFTYDDDIIEAAVWGFSDWASSVDSQFALRRRWYREGRLGGWVDELGAHWVCDLSIDPMCSQNVSKDNPAWVQKIISRAAEGFQAEAQTSSSPQEEEKRLEALRTLGYIDD
ncbi:MAG: hypothetical protein CL916_07010 [Deltaproteobacteria bacterium]|nr:hypothetical protein [Deltaproteobacteria bacterium]